MRLSYSEEIVQQLTNHGFHSVRMVAAEEYNAWFVERGREMESDVFYMSFASIR